MRGSIFALMQTTVGTGILTLSYIQFKVGIVMGTFFLLLGAFVAYYTMVWLMEATIRHEENNFQMIVKNKKVKKIIHFLVILSTFCMVVIYFVTTNELVYKLVQNKNNAEYFTFSLCFLLIIFLSIWEKLSSLQYLSLIGIISIFYVVILIFI